MPRFNSRGQVAAGVGDGIVSIDRVEVARGGGAEWWDDDNLIFGGHWTDGTWKLLCYNLHTKQISKLDDCEVTQLVGSGGHYFAVGARSLAASFPLLSQTIRPTPTATDGRGAGDRQGTIALSDMTGQGFTLRAKSGKEVSAAAGVACYNLTVVSATQAFWPANGGFESIGLPPIKVVGPPGRGCYCVVNGRPWIVYYRDGLGLITHPADDASRIQVIEAAPIFFHYDAIAIDGTIRVTYATTAAEAPDQVVIRNLDLSQLVPVFAPPSPPPPPPLPPPPHKEPTVPQAPNRIDVVQRVFAAHPEIDRMNEDTRGRAVDYVIAELGGRPWGRKARNKDGGNLNTDGLTYLRTDGKHEIYDIIDGHNGSATWDGDGTPFNPGENGYWTPGLPVDGGVVNPGPTPTPINSSLANAASLLEARIAGIDAAVKELKALVDALKDRVVEPKGVNLNGMRIALRTDNGHFVSAQDGGGGVLHAQRPEQGAPVEGYNPGGWETFTVVTR